MKRPRRRSDPICHWWFSDAELSEVAAMVDRADRTELVPRRPEPGRPPADDSSPKENDE